MYQSPHPQRDETINKINDDFFSYELSSITLYYIKMLKQVKCHDIFSIVVKINHTYTLTKSLTCLIWHPHEGRHKITMSHMFDQPSLRVQ
jgi:hypothetical protein